MTFWPFVHRNSYIDLLLERNQLRRENEILKVLLEEASKNDNRDVSTGRFVSAKKEQHLKNCQCFRCSPLKARKICH